MDKTNMKTFKVDYREKIRLKKEENERLKEEIQKQMEEAAKLEVLYIIFSY